MAIDWDTANSGLFVRFGNLAGTARDVISLKGGAATTNVIAAANIGTRGTTFETNAAASPALSNKLDGHWTQIESFRSAQSGFLSYLKSLAETLLIEQVHLDASLSSKDLTTALTEIDRQMRAASETLNASTVSLGSQTAVGSPTGTVKIVGTLKNQKGYTVQTPFAETIRFKVANDSGLGATARNEPMGVYGAAAAPDTFSHLYPAGSGASASLTIADAQRDNAGGNKLQNSDFETFTTANYPDNWIIGTGAAGTDVLALGSGYTQSNALRILGDGSTLTSLRQTFGATASTTAGAGGTPGTLLPSTRYALHGFAKVSSVPAAGVMRFRLVNSSNTVLTDYSGTDSSFTLALTGLTTSWASFSGVLITPAVLPSTYKLEMALTTALTNTVSAHFDDLCLTPMTSLYTGGPAFAAFAGDTNPALNDSWTIACSATKGVLSDWLNRFFDLNGKGIVLPSSGSPTNLDALVTG